MKQSLIIKLILCCVSLFLFLQIVLAALVSFPISQQWLLAQGTTFLRQELGIEAEIESVGIGLLPLRVSLYKVTVVSSDRNAKALQAVGLFQELPSLAQTSISLGALEIGLSPFAALTNRRSLLQDISISDFRVSVLNPEVFDELEKFLSKDSQPSSEKRLGFWVGYDQITKIAPRRLRIDHFVLELGFANNLNFVHLELEKLDILNTKGEEQTLFLSFKDCVFKHEKFPETYEIHKLAIESRVRPDRREFFAANDHGSGTVVLDALELSATGLDLRTKGTLRSSEAPGSAQEPQIDAASLPNLKINLSVDLGFEPRLLNLFDVRGAGKINARGELEYDSAKNNSGKKKADASAAYGPSKGEPFTFQGSADWVDVKLDDFDVYSGNAVFTVDGTELKASSAHVQTPKGASLDFSGGVSLTGTYHFYADAKIRKLQFLELLQGLGVSTDAIDFEINSLAANGIRVDGDGLLRDKRKFRLGFSGLLEASAIFVPSVTENVPKDFPLPNCKIELALAVDIEALVFDGSSARCANQEDHNIEVKRGQVKFENGETLFEIAASQVELSAVSYFARMQTNGLADISGQIRTENNGDDVVFEANFKSKSFEFDGFFLDELNGNVRVAKDGVTLTDLRGIKMPKDSQSEKLEVASRRVFIAFSKEPSRFELQVKGDLQAASTLYPGLPSLQELGGKVDDGEVEFGLMLNPVKLVALRAKLQASAVRYGPIHAQKLTADIDCNEDNCAKGSLKADAVHFMNRSADFPAGKVQVAVNKLSHNASEFLVYVDGVPVVLGSEHLWSSRLSSELKFTGTGMTFASSGRLIFSALNFDSQQLGGAMLSFEKAPAQPFVAQFSALSDQLSGKLILSTVSSVPNEIDVTAKNLDLMFLLPKQRYARNLFSSTDARFVLRFPSFFSDVALGSETWKKALNGHARVEKSSLATQGIRVWLGKPVEANLRSGKVEVDGVQLLSKDSQLELDLMYDIGNETGRAKLQGDVSIGVLSGVVPQIDRADGVAKLLASASFQPSGPLITGSVDLNAKSVRLIGFEPEFEEIRGRLLLDLDKVEILKLVGKKGTGNFEILGSILLPKENVRNEPDLGLKMRLTGVQSRIPAPIFRSIDSQLSGNIELSGASAPYDLRGQLSLDQIRAFRDLTCEEIVEAAPKSSSEKLAVNATQWLNFDVSIDSTESVNVITKCVKAKFSSKLRLQGTERSPRLSGSILTESGKVQVLKARFEIQRADIIFDSPITFDPRLDISLVAQIENYQIFMNLDGYSSSPRTSFWSEPSVTPWGAPVSQGEILRMIASGRAPKSPGAGGNALASQVATYVYGTTALDESLSKAFSKLTAGFVDTVRLQPLIENGQTTWKASVSRSVGERFNLGLDVEQSPIMNNQSLTGTLFVNETVNVLGGFDRIGNSSESYYELSGGFRFSFGGK